MNLTKAKQIVSWWMQYRNDRTFSQQEREAAAAKVLRSEHFKRPAPRAYIENAGAMLQEIEDEIEYAKMPTGGPSI